MISTRLVVFVGRAVAPSPQGLAVLPDPIIITGALSVYPWLLGTGVGEEQLGTPFHFSFIEALQSIGSTLDVSELHETSGKCLASVSVARYEE